MEITYYGHSCFGVKVRESLLLFDPFISGNPLAKHIQAASVQADYVLVSHAHGDHMADALDILRRTEAVLISNFEITSWFEKKGVSSTYGLNFGGNLRVPFGSVRLLHAIHSSQFPDGSYGGNPGAFLVQTPEGNFYFAGDTSLTMDMKLVPHYGRLDFAFLPIGGYFTMDFHDACLAAEFLQVSRVIGMHYDSFPPIKIDQKEAVRVFADRKLELILMGVGETRTI